MEWDYNPGEGKFRVTSSAHPNYELVIEPGCAKKFRDAKFVLYTNESRYVDSEKGPFVLVTGRDFENYNPKITNEQINPSLQYLEVGPGIGGFLERVVSMQQKGNPLPIAIEQADYSVMRKILNYSISELGSKLDDGVRGRLGLLLSRCDLMLNPDKVVLINRPVQTAAISRPWLEGCADRVVSNIACGHYAGNRKEYFQDILKSFLKPNGKLLQFEE